MKVSAVIIAKNEEQKIKDCLESVSFCDEIIVIDSGSTDTTVDIAKKHDAKVFSHPVSDFAKLRNIGLQKTNTDWILYIDADERVSAELKADIKKAIQANEYAAYFLKRKNYYFHTFTWPYVEKLERLFKKDALIEWYGTLHESPKVKGKVGTLDGFLLHYTHDSLSSMVTKTNQWSNIEARIRYDAHHPKMSWWRFPRVMLTAFFNSYITQGGWKAGTAGLIESIYQAFSIFITYAKLWELQHGKKDTR